MKDGLWELFKKTGLPEAYVAYKQRRNGAEQADPDKTPDGE